MLFVDDETTIRATLPRILEMHGFEVTSAASVPEALDAIHSRQFDLLLADLNIGHAGDGFTLISAMRRTQPECVNIIITGYPDFQAALEAIRAQVDDFVVKPTDTEELVALLKRMVGTHRAERALPRKRVAELLKENAGAVVANWLKAVDNNSEVNAVTLSTEERKDHLPEMLAELIERLQKHPEETTQEQMRAAALHGLSRRQHDYSAVMVVEETRELERVIFAMLQANLLSLDVSQLIPDMVRISDSLQKQLRESLRAYLNNGRVRKSTIREAS
ncbi:MAG: response regulator [Acidobacteriaceae bacterium]|nr:response regulator [Acidobacteriaceae bacterium]